MEELNIPNHNKTYMEAFIKYHSLKQNYENTYKKKRRDIRKSNELTMKQKLFKIKNIHVPCVQCGNKGGSKFYRKNRILYAKCNCNTPCSFSMEIKLSENYHLPTAINNYNSKLNEYKKNIVITKLNYLFDLEENDITSQRFNVLKEDFVRLDKQVNMLKNLLKQQLELIETTNDDGTTSNSYRSDVYNEKMESLHLHLKNIKKICINYKKNPEKYTLTDAITIYLSNVVPLIDEIKIIKYNQMYMDGFILKQNKYNIQNYSWNDPNHTGNVIENNFQKIKKKKIFRKRKKKKSRKDVVEEAKKEMALEVEELEEPPVAVAQEELMEKTDEPEATFDPDAQPLEEKKEPEKEPEKDVEGVMGENTPIEKQKVVNIEDIGELEEFEPAVDA